MPACVLSENGFMTNEKECRWLQTEPAIESIATTHVDAIVNYLNGNLQKLRYYQGMDHIRTKINIADGSVPEIFNNIEEYWLCPDLTLAPSKL